MLTSLVSAYYYLRVVVYIYMRKGGPQTYSKRWLAMTAGLTAVATILLGIFSAPLFNWASQAAMMLF